MGTSVQGRSQGTAIHQDFQDSTAQRHKGQNGSVALAVKRDFKKGLKRGNCFVRGIPGHFAKSGLDN